MALEPCATLHYVTEIPEGAAKTSPGQMKSAGSFAPTGDSPFGSLAGGPGAATSYERCGHDPYPQCFQAGSLAQRAPLSCSSVDQLPISTEYR